jgi:pyrroloquinoline quinone biosynthesis protein E
MSALGPPVGMLAELTHRCPLQCPYCSNPLDLLKANSELPTQTWLSIFSQAADMGVLQVHLSGGEPMLRPDLPEIVAALAARGVYTNLITAGASGKPDAMQRLAEAGLDHAQISFQGAMPETTDAISNLKGAHEKKLATARAARAAGLPVTVNAPIHRRNVGEVGEFIELALALGAERLEVANVQYYGWAYLNRPALMPARDDVLAHGRTGRARAGTAARRVGDRFRRAGLLRKIPKGLHGRLGVRRVHDHAVGRGDAVSCGSVDPRIVVRQCGSKTSG